MSIVSTIIRKSTLVLSMALLLSVLGASPVFACSDHRSRGHKSSHSEHKMSHEGHKKHKEHKENDSGQSHVMSESKEHESHLSKRDYDGPMTEHHKEYDKSAPSKAHGTDDHKKPCHKASGSLTRPTSTPKSPSKAVETKGVVLAANTSRPASLVNTGSSSMGATFIAFGTVASAFAVKSAGRKKLTAQTDSTNDVFAG